MVNKVGIDEVVARVIEKSDFDLDKFKMSIETLDYNDPMYEIKRQNQVGGSCAREEDNIVMCISLGSVV